MRENEICSSDLLAEKLQQINSLLQMVRRTLDSNESSIYLREAVDLMGSAGKMTEDCEQLRRQLDAQLYQQSSKYYESYSRENG